MKCTKHPMNEAIAICPTCGNGICEICTVNVMNVPHCKSCAEWMIFQMVSTTKMPLQLPVPRGTPKKGYFVIGGIGAMIMLVGAFCLGYFLFTEPIWYELASYPWWLIIFVTLLSGGMAITAVGFYGFYKNYGSTMGLISSVFLVISSFISPVSTIFSIQEYVEDFHFNEVRYRIGGEFAAAPVLVGICLVLMGVTLLQVKHSTMAKNLSTATGLFNIIIAALFCTILFAMFFGVAWFALVVACILMTLVFYLAKLPPKNAANLSLQIPTLAQPPAQIPPYPLPPMPRPSARFDHLYR